MKTVHLPHDQADHQKRVQSKAPQISTTRTRRLYASHVTHAFRVVPRSRGKGTAMEGAAAE